MAEHNRNNSDSNTTEAAPPPPSQNYGSLHHQTHPSQMTTYTAGEDSGRLATLAKEFGLSHNQARPPRPQIRSRYVPEYTLDKLNLSRLTKQLYGRMRSFDWKFEDLRLNAFMGTPHEGDDDDDYDDVSGMEGEEGELLVVSERSLSEGLLLTRLPSLEENDEASEVMMEENVSAQKPPLPKPSLEDPHAAGLGGSLSSATLGIIKGMVGPAILYLPHGFAMAGYLVAIPMLLLSTSLFLWSSGCLLDCWKMENSKQRRHQQQPLLFALSYPELAYRAWGIKGQRLVQIGISLMQSGVCLTYLIFVPQNLRTSALLLTGVDISTSLWLLLMVVVQIPLSWIRDIRRLTVTNLLANVLILFGLISCLGLAIRQMGEGESSNFVVAGEEEEEEEEEESSFMEKALYRAKYLPAFNPDGWFLFLGTSVLLFEGSITLLVPLIEAVHTREDKKKFPTMYRKVILGIVSFYAFFGIVCWMAIGDTVRTVMTTSLPSGTLATMIQLAYSLAVVFTFPLQNFPSLEIVCNSVEKMMPRYHSKNSVKRNDGNGSRPDKVKRNFSRSSEISNKRRNIISSMVVVSLSIIAMCAMNDLDKVVSLMGGLLGCPLAFVLPPLIENELGKDGRIGTKKRVVNVVVATLGVGAMFISTLTTLMNWE
mmetsp:Transcript_9228/g.15274  ORF Transcript_9228/g.15274 Transcript_9228/m.15274 type:complete len:652 (-) Transcript_9228:1303-3258(-)